MSKKISFILNLLRKNISIVFFLSLIFLIYLVNGYHTQFPDEFDNIFGGYLINKGIIPYTGFFTHHNPGAYYFASIITFFTRQSFVNFRIIFSLVLFLMSFMTYFLLRKKATSDYWDKFYFLFMIFIALGSTYWWGQMILSETLVGYFLVPVYLLIIIKNFENKRFTVFDLCLISILTFLSLFVSLTYIYLVPWIIFISLFFYWKSNKVNIWKFLKKSILIFGLPYLVFILYLFVTKGVKEFYFASIFYNMEYYIYNFPKVAGIHSHHPLRYAISIARNTFDNSYALLTQLSSLNLSYPFNLTLVLTIVGAIICFIMKRKFGLTLLIISMLFYTNARSEPLNIKETDFHATVFIMLTSAIATYLFYVLKKEIDSENRLNSSKIIYIVLASILGLYWFYNFLYISSSFVNKSYDKLMGNAPLIYDKSQTRDVFNKILNKDDYYWIGPFELQELLFINAKVASKYFWFLPANSRDNKIRTELISDFDKNKPKLIYFKKWWSNFGVKPEDFNKVIVDYLDSHYFQLKDINKEGYKLKVNIPRERDFDFENEMFFRIDNKAEIINRLLSSGMIEFSN